MPFAFEVVTDNSGRINHYIARGHPDDPINPGRIGECLDGGERVMLSGVEHDLTETGSLVHPDVDVIKSVVLGIATRIGRGTVFYGFQGKEEDRNTQDKIVIGDRTRIEGTKIHDQVSIGRSAIILAILIGHGTKIGDFTRMREGVVIQTNVTIGEAVKMARDVGVFSGVTIGDGARLGHATRVGADSIIGNHARIGVRVGPDRVGANQGGEYVLPGSVVPARHLKGTHRQHRK